MAVDPAAQAGFDGSAGTYERARPTYPPDALAALVEGCGVGPGRRVLDLAAGTGKLTRLLEPTGAHLVAVEPVAGMRATFRRVLPHLPVVAGTAERLPVRTASLDAVLVAQAFHWFDLEAAAAEAGRALVPGGALGLVWNERDESVAWVAELSRIIRWDERERWRVPYTTEVDWAARFAEADTPFGPLARFETTHAQDVDADLLVDRVLSTSYVAAGPQAERDRVEAEVRELVAPLPPTFPLPYRTIAYWGRVR